MQLIAARFGLVAALVIAVVAHAQPAPAASSPLPTERAQHDADKVFRMILQHADKPRRAPREDAAPAAATPRPAVAPAAKAATTPSATAAPVRAADSRVTATTPPAVPAVPTASAAPDTSVVPSSSANAVAAPDSAAAAQPAAAAVAAPAALAPVAVAAPRSLKLELVSSVEPEFPARLVRSLGRGSVVVNFDVRPDGSVARAEVASSSHRGLNEAALSAVAAWRFKPISETLPGVVELKFE
jgi:TonB family protein